jgi:excisionase family DNA binding protein
MYQLIAIQEAAKYTGLACSTLYAMVSQRRIPYVKVGRLVKFDMEQLNKWIKQNTVMPMPPRIN